ncbi:MAG: metallopeptidase TldD-related protein [Candidatus Coproplasma sp.]
MQSEKLTLKTTSYGVNVAGNKVDSLRLKEDMRTVVRVYDGGNIGIAGAIGEADVDSLYKTAEEKLSQNIPYPEMLEEGRTRSENRAKTVIPPERFVTTCKQLIARLEREYPDFIFSNKINLNNKQAYYENSKGTAYSYDGANCEIALSIKARSSANIMDLFYGAEIDDGYDEDKIVADVGVLLKPYFNRVPLPEEELPVIIDYFFAQNAFFDIIAERYMSGASIFAGKLGQKVFDEKLSILIDRSPDNKRCLPFFDSEGTTLKDDKFYFIKNGVLEALNTYKRSAATFNLPVSGCANADFDAVPSFGFGGVKCEVTCDSLKELVKGKAIYVSVTSGGDMTPDGDVGLPIILAYIYEDGKLTATLPEFGVSGNIFDLFGKDFIGIARNDIFGVANEYVAVAKFKINRQQ